MVRYTLDGRIPTRRVTGFATEGIKLTETTVVTAQVFRGDRPVSNFRRLILIRALAREGR